MHLSAKCKAEQGEWWSSSGRLRVDESGTTAPPSIVTMHSEAVVVVGKVVAAEGEVNPSVEGTNRQVVVAEGEVTPSVEGTNRPVPEDKTAAATSRTAVHSTLTRAVNSNDGEYSVLDRFHQLLPV